MGPFVGPPVVPRDHMRLETAGRGDEIVGKGEARTLASKGLGEGADFLVGFPAGKPGPPGDNGLFDGHGTVEVRDQTVPGGRRNLGEGGPFEATDLFKPRLGHRDQWRDFDEWLGATVSDDITGLAQHYHALDLVQHGRGVGFDGLSFLRERLGHLHGCGAERMGQVGEMKELQAGVEGDIPLTPGPEGPVDRLFVLVRQGHGALVQRLGRPSDPDGAGLGRHFGPVLHGFQQKRRRGWAPRILSATGEWDAVSLERPVALAAGRGLVESASVQEVQRRISRSLVDREQECAGVAPPALIEIADRGQHPPDCLIVPGADLLAVRPVMDTAP